MEKDVIMGNHIYLRPIKEEDTDYIIKWRNKDRVRMNFIYQKLFTQEGHLAWIEDMLNKKKAVQFIICEKKTDRMIGSTYLRDISLEHHKAEYGVFIGEDDAVGKGYGTETAKLMIYHGFRNLKLHKIFLRVLADNKQAIECYQRAGFVEEAYLINDVYLEGNYKDVVLMGKITTKDSLNEGEGEKRYAIS